VGLQPLSPAELRAAVPDRQALVLEGTFLETRTPLWFYILAEASREPGGPLGPVGSRIVAGVLEPAP